MRPPVSRSPAARRIVNLAAAAGAALVVAGCSAAHSADREDALAEDLRHDLELASSAGIELAGSQRGRLTVVSAVEQGPRTEPVRAARSATPRALGRKRAAPAPKVEEPAPAPAPEGEAAATEIAAADEETVEPIAPVAEPEPQPSAEPSPAVVEQGSGGSERGRGIGTAIGTVIGVVIRGAVVGGGVDDCDERVHRPRGGVISAGMPLPLPGRVGGGVRFPQTAGTFPRY